MSDGILIMVDTRDNMQLMKIINRPEVGVVGTLIKEIKELVNGDLNSIARARIEDFTGKTIFTLR